MILLLVPMIIWLSDPFPKFPIASRIIMDNSRAYMSPQRCIQADLARSSDSETHDQAAPGAAVPRWPAARGRGPRHRQCNDSIPLTNFQVRRLPKRITKLSPGGPGGGAKQPGSVGSGPGPGRVRAESLRL